MKVKPRKSRVVFRSAKSHPSSSAQSSKNTAFRESPGSRKGMMASDTTRRLPEQDAQKESSVINEWSGNAADNFSVPNLFTSYPPIKDPLVTNSSDSQDEVVDDCLSCMADSGKSPRKLNSNGIPKLEREKHIDFLKTSINNAKYIPFDAARPWVVYWCLTGLSLLGEDVGGYRERVVQTFAPAQNASGGFGGGHGQLSHLAPSYTTILSLATVGGSESAALIDRRSLWKWLGQLKQADGGFRMSLGGEEDVRGAYCATVIISLLSLPLELPLDASARSSGLTSLIDGLPEYLSRCQTYEGGISGVPQGEAQGSYAFLAVACLCILGRPQDMLSKYLDLPLLISWLSARQYAPEGGFSGRTNKLVDSCYSHWVGGCWPLINAALKEPQSSDTTTPKDFQGLYNEEGLIRYIMSCCQGERGGLRDKPDVRPDAHHTCYALAGLSSTQHVNYYSTDYRITGDIREQGTLDVTTHWKSNPKILSKDLGSPGPRTVIDEEDRIEAIHPVYAIPWAAADWCHQNFSRKEGF